MDKKLKIIIIIQAFVVVFLLGILLGMNIQKKRMIDNGNSIEDTSLTTDNVEDVVNETKDHEQNTDDSNDVWHSQ